MTISNMAIEVGGKAGIMEVDDVARAWLEGRCQRPAVEYHADPGAEYALIDGNRDAGITIPHETVVKGDSRSPSIAAASILAKVLSLWCSVPSFVR